MSAPEAARITDALALPLTGTRLVEASAGTGKTFTIATLYLRLILERGLAVDEIVVATFTRAAAAELSERLRQRLRLACGLLAPDAAAPRPAAESGEAAETRRVIAQALQAGVARGVLAARAESARFALDTALIGTLHGFCHRALAEFGFSAGQGLQQPELIDDATALADDVVHDFWRRGSADARTARILTTTWRDPDALGRQAAGSRWRGREASVPEPDASGAAQAFEAIRHQIAQWDADARAEFDRELERCIDNARARSNRAAAFAALGAWAATIDPAEALAAFDDQGTKRLLADELAKLVPKGARPEGRVFDAIAALLEAHTNVVDAQAAAEAIPAARLLREAHDYVTAEVPKRLAERNLMSHDTALDALAAALDSPRGQALAGRLGERWKAALIDEFQDTDAIQWHIVRQLFGASTLIVVGDPKQAIYGFRGGDVYAWRAASEWARRHQGEAAGLRLTQSYRAGAGLCAAINALFSRPAVAGGEGAFIEPIDHPDLASAGPVRNRALLRSGVPAAALQLWWLDPDEIGHARTSAVPAKRHVYAAVQRACVAWIANALADPAITLRDESGDATRLAPRHVAVLVNANAEALAMQAALARAGIAAACNLQASVYASDEAADLALLLAAVAAPDDLRAARAARASVLQGDDAAALAATLGDAAAQGALLEEIAGWVVSLRRRGPAGWLLPLLEAAAPRLLALADGRRRVANYLQLIELLQQLHAQSFGAGDLAARFGRARAEATDNADAERLRLDTDADAVTVSTIHAAKGLEYDVVLLPYAVLGRAAGRAPTTGVPMYWYHDDDGRPRVALGQGTAAAVRARAARERRAEAIRQCYVAVTRAAALCIVPYGPTSATRFSAVHHLLHVAGRTPAAALHDDRDGCRQALRELCARARGAAEIVEALPRPAGGAQPRKREAPEALQARRFQRSDVERDWQVWSFSRLVRGSPNDAAPDPAPGTGDGEALPALPAAGLAGPRFGTAVHAVFEATDFAAWRDAAAAPVSECALIEASLRAQGLPDRGIGMDAAIGQIGDCVRGALNATLPCGMRLCDLPAGDRRAEIEFHFALAPTATAGLYRALHAHGYQIHREGLAPPRLRGLMTGRIDLTFRHAGRFHIIDWKTNLCAAYDDAALVAEIARHDYDLQWLIYTLALHRWLRRRLPGYDYARDVGDVYYLFVRGMATGAGVHVARPPRALIEALDGMFQSGDAT